MEMNETGFARWTPTLAQAGGRGHDVVVAVLDEAGRGTQQAYTIIASERVHPLGTDDAGRDMLAALILGTRWTIWPGLVAAGLSLLLGVGFGGLAGYYERRANAFLSYSATLSDSLPALLLIFLAAVIFRYNLYPVMLVLGVVLFPAVARGIKARVLSLKARQFIEASRELGLSDAQILWHDIVWHNARPVLVTRLFYALALAVAVEVTLSYLRLGIQPPAVSWGNLILAGRARIENHQYWLAFWPALATIIAVAGYYLLGSGLARRFRVHGT
jgi:peptide/nickel transport system permease protein